MTIADHSLCSLCIVRKLALHAQLNRGWMAVQIILSIPVGYFFYYNVFQ